MSPFLKSLDASIEKSRQHQLFITRGPKHSFLWFHLLPKTGRSRRWKIWRFNKPPISCALMRFKWVIHNAQKQHNLTTSHKLTKYIYIKIRGQCVALLKVLIYTRNTGHSTKQQNIPHHELHHDHLLHLFFDWLTVSLPFSLGIRKCQVPFAWLHTDGVTGLPNHFIIRVGSPYNPGPMCRQALSFCVWNKRTATRTP